MKQIGHIDGATTAPADWKTHTLDMLSPHDLFIPNPGERENVSADQWTHVGWVDPDKDGGQIWGSHAEAGDNSRPAYVRMDMTQPVPIEHSFTEKPVSDSDRIENAMTAIIRLNKRLDDLENRYDRAVKDLFLAIQPEPDKVDLTPEQVDKAVAKLTTSKEYGEIGRPVPSTIPTGELLSEATEFCNEELDRFDGLDFDSDAEVGCQRSATYIRELVRRLSEHREALRPFTAAGADGRGSALPDSDPLAIISANMPDLPSWIAKARGVVTMGDVRRAMNLFKDERP